MRVWFLWRRQPKNRLYLQQHFAPERQTGTRLCAAGLPASGLCGCRGTLQFFIHSQGRRATLELMPNLRLIAARSTGFDHIDLQACAERHITVCNVPRYGENTVAEHTLRGVIRFAGVA